MKFNLNEIFKSQGLFRCKMRPEYLPENLSAELFSKFNITDSDGNKLALYKDDYFTLKNYLKSINPRSRLDLIQKEELFAALKNVKLRMVKYFSSKNLAPHELDINAYNITGELVSVSGNVLYKNGHQNCVVLINDKIYIHPKIRPITAERDEININENGQVVLGENAQFGVNHSSLTDGRMVEFPGSFVHSQDIGWKIVNISGHYSPRATQMRNFIKLLHEKGIKLDNFTVELWIPHNPMHLTDKIEEYTIIHENALAYFYRLETNIANLSR